MKFLDLRLLTTPLEAMYTFYVEQLGFPVLGSGPDDFVLAAGDSRLRFERATGDPYYHFAFNIPASDVEAAGAWLRERHEILDWNGKEIIDFENWKAKAVYYKDPAGNIGEFIGRRPLGLSSQAPFSAAAIHSISEMGVPTTDIRGIDAALSEVAGLAQFDCNIERFCAIGDDAGLFIVIDYHRKKWIPKNDPAIPFPFSCRIENGGVYEIDFADETFWVAPEG